MLFLWQEVKAVLTATIAINARDLTPVLLEMQYELAILFDSLPQRKATKLGNAKRKVRRSGLIAHETCRESDSHLSRKRKYPAAISNPVGHLVPLTGHIAHRRLIHRVVSAVLLSANTKLREGLFMNLFAQSSFRKDIISVAGVETRPYPATHRTLLKVAVSLCAIFVFGAISVGPSFACTRTLFVAPDGTVITGRNMDWSEDMASNLWVFPAGIAHDGAAGPRSIKWTSRYGSLIVSAYDVGSADGINEKGLVGNLLYLAESQYGNPADSKAPLLSISLWLQYVLDNFATVDEAVTALQSEPFVIIAPTLPNGAPSALHLSISDSTGDSAIFEYVDGKLKIHHGKQYLVMTNSPIYDKQLANNEYWESIGGLAFLPGTNRAADRFARASFFINSVPKTVAPNYIKGVPDQKFAYQAVAEVLSIQRGVSVPLGLTTPDQPNISSTIWRTAADQKNLIYYFDSATRPDTFWVVLSKLNLKAGAPVMKLTISNGEVFAGEVSDKFQATPSFTFLPANPNGK